MGNWFVPLAFSLLAFCCAFSTPPSAAAFEEDSFDTSEGKLTITFLGHGTLMLSFAGKVIHVDPYSRVADYAVLPKADLVLITHDHPDHLDQAALQAVRKAHTTVAANESAGRRVEGAVVMKNGDARTIAGLRIEAVPAYNLVHMRSPGQPFHPKGVGNGYVVDFGDKKVYIAGDTENIPEMAELKGIDIAFLPMNLPYTMTPEMTADAARSFMPKILYPYHFGETDTGKIAALLKDSPEIEVRIRSME